MNFDSRTHDEIVSSIADECSVVLKQGSMPMLQLIARNMKGESRDKRTYYMLGGLRALGEVNLEMITQYFDILGRMTPEEEKQIHSEAVEVVFNSMVQSLLDNTKMIVEEIASSIGIGVKLVFTTDDVPGSTQETTPPGTTLH